MSNHSSKIAWFLVAWMLFAPKVEADTQFGCGANVPFVSYEAEESESNATVVGMNGLPRPNEASPEIEASKRSYLKLTRTGEYCQITAKRAGNAILVRHCIPDAVAGGGTTATLSLFINGKLRQKLVLNSQYNWLYGSVSSPHGGQLNEPNSVSAHVFWNDTRFLIDGGWQEGDTLRLEKSADDTAEYYDIDLVDLEMTLPPLDPPIKNSYLSITDFGATGGDTTDDTQAIELCLAAAKAEGKSVWFPPGAFYHSHSFHVDGIAVQGAGVWHTQLIGTKSSLGFVLAGHKPRVADLFIESTAHHSRSDPGGMVFRSRQARAWSVENVWITHSHGGFWLGGAVDGVIRGCRIYCTYADTINLNHGSSRNLVEQNYIRGAGDDGIATLSLADQGEVLTVDNTFRSNTVVCNWWGHNIDVAGGSGHVVEDNYLADNSHSGCFTFNLPSAYPMHPLTNVAVRRNTIVRGGGNHAGQQRGAIWSFADDAPITGVVFEANKIIAPIFRGFHMHGGAKQEVVFKNNVIVSPGIDAVRIDPTVKGKLSFSGNEIHNLPPDYETIDNQARSGFELIESDTKLD